MEELTTEQIIALVAVIFMVLVAASFIGMAIAKIAHYIGLQRWNTFRRYFGLELRILLYSNKAIMIALRPFLFHLEYLAYNNTKKLHLLVLRITTIGVGQRRGELKDIHWRFPVGRD